MTEGCWNPAHGGGDRQRDMVVQGVTLAELPVIQPKVFWHKASWVYYTCANFCFGGCLFLLCKLI